MKVKGQKLREKGEGGRGEEAGNGFELLNEAMTREEVEQALEITEVKGSAR